MDMRWGPKYETGIAVIDKDHRILFDLFEQTQQCVDDGEESFVLGSVIASLLDYVRLHFHREEILLDRCGYSALGAHQQLHVELKAAVELIAQRFKDHPERVGVREIRNFLWVWLSEHILGEDMPYVGVCMPRTDIHEEIAKITLADVLNEGKKRMCCDWPSLRVLVVDDNANFQRLFKTLLLAFGVKDLRLAGSAAEGFRKLAHGPVDVVICDWLMDDMNGLDFMKTIRESGDETPILILSGFGDEAFRNKACNSGANAVLEKPISANSFLQAVSGILPEAPPVEI
ncbi:MAG: bacteriohemerythrin [Alphaproteobacteria bacterium]|nr:bacteriohemerythrin [Alphaproteobacteria bacterium]